MLQDLELVYAACPALQMLKLSSCTYLREDALDAILPPLGEGHLDRVNIGDAPLVSPLASQVLPLPCWPTTHSVLLTAASH